MARDGRTETGWSVLWIWLDSICYRIERNDIVFRVFMSYSGTVKNGVVVLEPGVKLPEGTPVRVETLSKANRTESASDPAFTIADLAVDCGIPEVFGQGGDVGLAGQSAGRYEILQDFVFVRTAQLKALHSQAPLSTTPALKN